MNRLEELKEQQKGFVSFAAKQAYINGLEIELQKAEAHNKFLEKENNRFRGALGILAAEGNGLAHRTLALQGEER